jgi:DNA-binding response OmpR family regulator
VSGFVQPLATASKFRVLYVGNDLKFIAAFREVVSESVYRLVTCSDHESIILFLKSDIPYDLMLIDHDWRGNEGLKLARLARSQSHRKQMPIVLLSSVSLDRETRALVQKASVVECALKSADLSKLVSRVIVAEE